MSGLNDYVTIHKDKLKSFERMQHALTVIAEGCEEVFQDWGNTEMVCPTPKAFVVATGLRARKALEAQHD